MKKIILSAMAVFAFGFMNAQEVSFGAKAGLNIANLSGDVEDTESLMGLHVGAFAEINFSERFSFQPELLYSMQGAKMEESELGVTMESKLKLGYINLPLMVKFYAAENFFLEAGPQVGFLMSAKSEWETSGGGASLSGDEDVKDDFKSIDFGLNFGLGYNFTENLSVGARYNLGLSNIADVDDSDDFKINNSVIQVSVGYRF